MTFSELRGRKFGGVSALWVFCNSVYYVGMSMRQHVKLNDYLVSIGHRVTGETVRSEYNALNATTTTCDFGNHHLAMHMAGTNDHYSHTSRTLMDINYVPIGNTLAV